MGLAEASVGDEDAAMHHEAQDHAADADPGTCISNGAMETALARVEGRAEILDAREALLQDKELRITLQGDKGVMYFERK